MCCDKGSSTYPLHDSLFCLCFCFVLAKKQIWFKMNSALHFDILNDPDTCPRLFSETFIVVYLLRNFFDELKEISICIIMSDDRIRDAFQSASSTQVGRIDNEWLWSRYLCTRYERSKNSTKLFFSSRMKNSSNSS